MSTRTINVSCTSLKTTINQTYIIYVRTHTTRCCCYILYTVIVNGRWDSLPFFPKFVLKWSTTIYIYYYIDTPIFSYKMHFKRHLIRRDNYIMFTYSVHNTHDVLNQTTLNVLKKYINVVFLDVTNTRIFHTICI